MNVKDITLKHLKMLRDFVSPDIDKETISNNIQPSHILYLDKNYPYNNSIILNNIQDIVDGYMCRHYNGDMPGFYDFLNALINEIEQLY